MAPMIVLAVVTLLAAALKPWRDATRVGLIAMFLFTATAHFTATRHDLAAMIPPPLTGAMGLIYLTGLLEIAGAAGLAVPRVRKLAATGLVLLLIALFPANVYAALHAVPLRGSAPTPLWLRAPMQILWIALLWWTSIRSSNARAAAH